MEGNIKQGGKGMKIGPGRMRYEHLISGKHSASRRDLWEILEKNGMSVTFFKILPLRNHPSQIPTRL